MRLSRLGRACWAIWLGMLVCNLHAALPILVVADILYAVAPEDGLRLCSAAPIHAVSVDTDGRAPANRRAHGNACRACSLCLALSASAAFTGPSVAPLPLPAAGRLPLPRFCDGTTDAMARSAAYRSRAPPIG
jgi:hypothetical protein